MDTQFQYGLLIAMGACSLTTYFASLFKGGYRGHKHAAPLPLAPDVPLDTKWTVKDEAHLEEVLTTQDSYPANGPILRNRTRSKELPSHADGYVDPMGYATGQNVSHMSHTRANNNGHQSAATQNAGEADPMGYTNNTGPSHMDPARQGV